MNINVTTVQAFLAVARLHGVQYLLDGNGRLEGVCSPNQYGHRDVVALGLDFHDTPMMYELSDGIRNYSSQSRWYFNERQASITVQSKVGLIKVLSQLGVEAAMLAKLKTVKATQLREVFDTTPVVVENDVEIETIMLRLTSSADKVKFKTKSEVIPNVTVKMTGSNQPDYCIAGDASEYIKKQLVYIKKQLDAEMFSGSTGR